jgi:hypothetical protein
VIGAASEQRQSFDEVTGLILGGGSRRYEARNKVTSVRLLTHNADTRRPDGNSDGKRCLAHTGLTNKRYEFCATFDEPVKLGFLTLTMNIARHRGHRDPVGAVHV